MFEEANYISEISGPIDTLKTDLNSYKKQTEVYKPLLVKKETGAFTVSAKAAFKVRKC